MLARSYIRVRMFVSMTVRERVCMLDVAARCEVLHGLAGLGAVLALELAWTARPALCDSALPAIGISSAFYLR